MKIRHKLVFLVVIYISGIIIIALLSLYGWRRTAQIQDSVTMGVELQLKSREVQSLMKDIVFDLFVPEMYGHIRSLTYSPRSAVTLKQWQESVIAYNRIFNDFMISDHFPGKNEGLIRDQYYTALRMNTKAMSMLSHIEKILILINDEYASEENLYSAMMRDEALTPFFAELREASYYFKNSFESFMNHFIRSLNEEADRIQKNTYWFFLITTGCILLFSILFTLYLSKNLTLKLSLMEKAFRKVSYGDFSGKLSIISKDEFGAFSITFNELINDLKENVNNILNLTRDIGSFISDKSELSDLYNLVAGAVVQDTSADTAVLVKSEMNNSFQIVAVKGNQLSDKTMNQLLSIISNKVYRPNSLFTLNNTDIELSQSVIKSLLIVPLTVEGKNHGLLISVKTTSEDGFSDLGITRFSTFAEYVSLTLDNFFKYKELIERREAQYQALQSQVQPHFLYNILTVILGLNRKSDRAGIVATVTALKEMLRYIQSQNRWTSIEQECNFIKQYCSLQKIRFGDRFSYQIEFDEEAGNFQIPRLLLQPLLENSVIHGIEPLEKNGIVNLTCIGRRYRGEPGVIIHITDNGVGFDSSELKERSNVGIMNVEERLKLTFPESVLTITSKPGEGTVVKIEI
jgi:sensor histidine kinase YesM